MDVQKGQLVFYIVADHRQRGHRLLIIPQEKLVCAQIFFQILHETFFLRKASN